MNKNFTWGEILLATCRKMFLNKDAIAISDLPDLVDDRNYSTYLNMAPDVMNELITVLNNRVLINIKRLTVDITHPSFLDYLSKDSDYIKFRIREYLFDNLQEDEELDYLYTEVIQYANIKDDNLLFDEQEGILYIDRRFYNESNNYILIKYRIIPYKYTIDTEYDKIIDLPYNITSIVPLYLASELYKDDDISLSTQYRNQFESELDFISTQMVDSLGVEHSRDVGGYYGS